jgi:hypothetical protein
MFKGRILVHVSVGGRSIAGPPRCPGSIFLYLWGGVSGYGGFLWRIDR